MITSVKKARLYQEMAAYNNKVSKVIPWAEHPDNREDSPGDDFHDVLYTYWGDPEGIQFRPTTINLEDVNYDRDLLGDYENHEQFYNDRDPESARIKYWQNHFDQHGSLPPSTVIKDTDGKWVLLDGSHRADVAWRNGLRQHQAYEIINRDPSVMSDYSKWYDDDEDAYKRKASKWKLAERTIEEQEGLKGWPKIMAKAQRLRQQGSVLVKTNSETYVEGQVEGDNGVYETQLWRDNAGSQKISAWQCSCPWFQYAFGRTRKWKKYEGRPCAHLLALYWEGLSQPLTDAQQPQIEEQPAVEPAPNYQQLQGTLPEIVDSPVDDLNPAVNLLSPNTQKMTRTIKDALKFVHSGGQR